jgi:hypothetical protein
MPVRRTGKRINSNEDCKQKLLLDYIDGTTLQAGSETRPPHPHPVRWGLTEKQWKIYQEMLEKPSQAWAAKQLGISRNTVKEQFRPIKKVGLARLIGYNSYEILRYPIGTTTSNDGRYTHPNSVQEFFVHKFRVKTNLRQEPLRPRDIKKAYNKIIKKKCWIEPSKYWELSKNNPLLETYGKGWSARVRTKSIVTWITGIRGNDVVATMDELQGKGEEETKRIAEYLNIRVDDNLRYEATIDSVHIAYINNSVWDILKRKGWDRVDINGEIRLILDRSKGERHIEFQSTSHAEEDATAFVELVADLDNGIRLRDLERRISNLEKQKTKNTEIK